MKARCIVRRCVTCLVARCVDRLACRPWRRRRSAVQRQGPRRSGAGRRSMQLDYENTVKALDSAIGAIEARPTPEVAAAAAGGLRDARPRAVRPRQGSRGARRFRVAAEGRPRLRARRPGVAAHHRDVRRGAEDQRHRAAAGDHARRRRSAARRHPRAGLGNDADCRRRSHAERCRESAIGPRTHPFTAVAGAATVVDALALERVATVLQVRDRARRRRSRDRRHFARHHEARPAAGRVRRTAARAGVPAAELSAVLTVTELPVGAHRIAVPQGLLRPHASASRPSISSTTTCSIRSSSSRRWPRCR